MPKPVSAAQVKEHAKMIGADLCGIASCATLNAYPPDPSHPQTPERIDPEAKSAVVVGKHVPLGGYMVDHLRCYQHLDQLVIRRTDRLAFEMSLWLDGLGYPSAPIVQSETSPDLKRGSYGYLSFRHVAIEAGMGSLGIDLNLLTPEYGPRVYVSVLLTHADLEPDARTTEQLCIGETCSRCLYACPPDAVKQFALDKRGCAQFAQPHGMNHIYRYAKGILDARDRDERLEYFDTKQWDLFAITQGLVRLIGAFGACPRCIEVCPVGDDYLRYLKRRHKDIPEQTPQRVARSKEYVKLLKERAEVTGRSAWNIRWVGEQGYRHYRKVRGGSLAHLETPPKAAEEIR